MTIQQNPKLDIETLSLLRRKIEINEASPEDYKILDYFLQVFDYKNFILEKLRKYEIYSYEEYIIERKQRSDLRNKNVNGDMLGIILGAISALEKYITNKL